MRSFIKLFFIIYLFSLNIYFNMASTLSSSSLSSSSSYLLSAASDLNTNTEDTLDDFDFIENENISNDSIENFNLTQTTIQPPSIFPSLSPPQLQSIIKSNNINNIEDDDNIESEITNDYLPIKRKMIKNAITKSLTHKTLSQKFVEVIPILRVLSSQQKIALSSLISAQISAKPGTELKLSQVRSIFGNNQKLILPLVLDIANMVRNAAKSSLNNHYDTLEDEEDNLNLSSSIQSSSAESNFHRRVFDQSNNNNYKNHRFDENNFDNEDIANDDDNYYGEIMDPIIINNELYDAYRSDKGSNSSMEMKLNEDSQST